MRHEEERASPAQEKILEPADGLYVQVIGRFVQEDEIGLPHQSPGQQHAALETGRELFEGEIRQEIHAGDDRLDGMAFVHLPLVGPLRMGQSAGHHIEGGSREVLGHLLVE